MCKLTALFLVMFSVVICEETLAAKIPKNWKTCKLDSQKLNECLKVAAEEAVQDLANGKPSLGVYPLDPMHFDTISIDQGSGPVSVKLDFKDLDIIGIKDLKITKMDTDWHDMKVDVEIPVLTAVGTYKAEGKILVLPISGEGPCNLTFIGFTGTGYLKFKEVQKADKKYYQITNFNFTLNSEKMKIKLDNLFNGDKALGDNMNLFLNENWPEILAELKPAVSKAFSVGFKEVGNRVFTKIPLEQISPS